MSKAGTEGDGLKRELRGTIHLSIVQKSRVNWNSRTLIGQREGAEAKDGDGSAGPKNLNKSIRDK